MSTAYVTTKIEGGIAEITLNRPQKRNALNRAFLQELNSAVRSVAADSTVRLLMLSAAGPVFCAGMDLGEMQERADQPDALSLWDADTRSYRDLLVELFRLPVPTLAVVQGPAVAGGLGLVLACDVVLAADSARFALPEPMRGLTAAVLTPFLLHRVGPGAAGYLLLSGRSLTAADALRWGLVHEASTADELPRRRDELCRSILTGSPAALTAMKRFLLDVAAEDVFARLEAATVVSAEARASDDAREGLCAFLERRPPRWSREST